MRILRGSLKGLLIKAPDLPNLRPTQGKVREALWSILDFEEKGTFVDLFAGSGLVAVEACSTGYVPVFAVEKDPVLCKNLAAVQKGHSLPLTVFREDVLHRLGAWAGDGRTFPLVFADPPYDYDRLEKLLDQVLTVLTPGGRFILESQKPFLLEHRAEKIYTYGKTVLAFFRR